MSHRNTHYYLWFLLFGVIPFIQTATNHFPADAHSYTSYWLAGSGLLGILLGMNQVVQANLARPYDIILGIVFGLAGLLGILAGFHVNTGGVYTFVSNRAGLLLGFPYPLIYAFLGLKSLHHGLEKSK